MQQLAGSQRLAPRGVRPLAARQLPRALPAAAAVPRAARRQPRGSRCVPVASIVTGAVSAPASPGSSSAAGPPFVAWESKLANKFRRTDIKRIMILGAGPIVIGQACEFDYSGTQACKALRELGYEVILINSNPATIMTDPETANRTYIGPMTPELVEEIIEKERPDALLPTMGGQTALNLAVTLAETGVLKRLGVELIGAKLEAINMAEDRLLFKNAMERIGLKCAQSGCANSMEQALAVAEEIGAYPLIIRPAFTLGGTGGGIAYNREEFEAIVAGGIAASAVNQVLVERSLLGWKEYELEVMRDLADNVVIICSIENIDPMGVHTGDSITLAPAQTLTDREYQRMRDAAVAIIREIGVECGGSNVQFAVNPADGELIIIEMNPRVSRSSALASKATGFPIAKIAAKLAVGYTLDGIPNDITLKTPASFEPSIDYIVTKIPRFAFEKFPGSSPTLNTQMKSVGESMAIGRTFQESFQKALRSLETGLHGWGCLSRTVHTPNTTEWEALRHSLRVPNPERMSDIHKAMAAGMTQKEVCELTNMDRWFVDQMGDLLATEQWLQSVALPAVTPRDFLQLKRKGYSDRQLAAALGSDEQTVRAARVAAGVTPSMKRVDTCAAEFAAETPYMYSSYDGGCEARPTTRSKVLILGGGPNRIGQGIEFDYCCCHAAFALRKAGYEAIMLNSNPETVSTDYDTSDRLYFEPLTVEDVLNVIEIERPMGVIVQFGGQTPLKLAKPLQAALEARPIPSSCGNGFTRILGTSPDAIDAAEDRERFEVVLRELGIAQPPGGVARSKEEALAIAKRLGYPVMVRPSYVLGGRAMQIVASDAQLEVYIQTAVQVDPERPVLVDKYLEEAGEIDVDALCDVEGNVVIGGIMEHIEQAGVHSGDSACTLPAQTVPKDSLETIRRWTPQLAKALGVVGLLNIQYAVRKNGDVYILEANPRASRTVPFVAKAVGHPLAAYATLLMVGKTLKEVGLLAEPIPEHVSVKEAVLPFEKFPGADTLLGPEMRSTGEVMGIDQRFDRAYAKAQIAAGQKMPLKGTVFVSVRDADKAGAVMVAGQFSKLGFSIVATGGTRDALQAAGVPVARVLKIHEGRPHVGDMLRNREIDLLVVSSNGDAMDLADGRDIRRLALSLKVPLVTTISGAKATADAIGGMQKGKLQMKALQDYHTKPAAQ